MQALDLYRRKARNRGILFTLTREQAFALFQSNCYYCAGPPANIARANTDYGMCLYTGIDRIVPSQGYVPDNVRPCCWNCNRMKGTMGSEQLFYEHVQKILDVQKRRQRRRRK